jgi:hypothetical protein
MSQLALVVPGLYTPGFFLQNGVCSCLIGTYGPLCEATAYACHQADPKRVIGIDAIDSPTFSCTCPLPFVPNPQDNGQTVRKKKITIYISFDLLLFVTLNNGIYFILFFLFLSFFLS